MDVVGPGDAAAEAETSGLRRERFDMARHRVIALVAMQIDHEAELFGDRA
jgi:hypothetical protein